MLAGYGVGTHSLTGVVSRNSAYKHIAKGVED